MDTDQVLELIKMGEDSKTQFKENFNSPDRLAQEMVAFSNARGGRIIIGVSDFGEIKGLSIKDIHRLNQLISNVASNNITPPINPLTELIKVNRLEIISPGKLPNTLTTEKIKYGLSLARNPVLTSFASKILPHRGVGTGIIRALKAYPDIELINNIELNQFESIIPRKDYSG